MNRSTPTTAESTRAFLDLSRLLTEVEREHPEISGPLRLTLARAHREHQVGWLDERRFREVVADLVRHAPSRSWRGTCRTTSAGG